MSEFLELENGINTVWDQRDTLTDKTKILGKKTVDDIMAMMSAGKLRVAEKKDGSWHVNQWVKKAILLSFRMNDNSIISGGPGAAPWFD